jgi:uncharacterized damage-inducible protein DinB
MMPVAVLQQNLHFLHQGAKLLARLGDEAFKAPPGDRPRTAGVGSHLRHCLDFYRCFLRDLESGRIDYDRRDRDLRIESDRSAALVALEDVVNRLQALDEVQADRTIEVRGDAGPCEDPAAAWHRSTVGRELRFLASHTVHHYALIAHLLRALGVELDEEFGVAPATLRYWDLQASTSTS